MRPRALVHSSPRRTKLNRPRVRFIHASDVVANSAVLCTERSAWTMAREIPLSSMLFLHRDVAQLLHRWV